MKIGRASPTDFQNKIPAITAGFWIMKITATTLGETAGDWASMTLQLGYLASTLIFFTIFVLALGIQLASRHYLPLLFWTVIVATSTAGTTLSDYMDRTLEFGYTKGAIVLASVLIAILVSWRFVVGTVSVNKVQSRTAEIFYWLAILVSNTLGTALGDFLADDSGLGFLGSWLLITGILGLILLLYSFSRLSRTFLFWIAFILTRPFGATFGDVLTKAPSSGGLDLGRGYTSLILLALLIACICIFRKRGHQES